MTTGPLHLEDWTAAIGDEGGRLRKQAIQDWFEKLETGFSPLPHHAGLWLDRCLIRLKESGQGSEGKGEQIGREALFKLAIASLRVGPGARSPAVAWYAKRLERHRARAQSGTPGSRRLVFTVEATSRILLHPATGSSVTEGSLLLHHTYGVPYLPGTAIKGACRSLASRLWDARTVRGLFGCVEAASGTEKNPGNRDEEESHAGLFDFWDALWIPEPPAGEREFSPLALDVVTPHHGSYYVAKNDDRPPPAETDDPVPARLLSYRPGTRFLVVLEYADIEGIEAWVGPVKRCLLDALEQSGVGAKTAAGYGRLREVGALEALRAGAGQRRDRTVARAKESGGTEPAFLSYQKNSGTLVATLSEGKAEALGEEGRTLFRALPEQYRKRLERGKTLRVNVRWRPLGRAKRLEAVEVD